VPVGGLPGQSCRRLGQLDDAIGDAVLAQRAEVGAETVGLDEVGTGGQVRLVDLTDDVRAGDVEDLVAALVALEVVETEVEALQHGAHRPVGNEDPACVGEQLVVRHCLRLPNRAFRTVEGDEGDTPPCGRGTPGGAVVSSRHGARVG
jgi:hypothetical protein